MLKKTITQLFILTIVISCIFLANGLILAWTSPGYNPPDGNVDAPLNIGSDSQYKLGALGVEGIFRGYSNAIFDGNVGIGITNPGAKLEVEGNIIADEPTQNGHVATKFYVDRIVTQFECTSGAVSKINLLTGAVECRDVAGVTSPDYLVYNQHTTNACTSLGGTVKIAGTVNICAFSGGSCPSGWANYYSWSITSNVFGQYVPGTRCYHDSGFEGYDDSTPCAVGYPAYEQWTGPLSCNTGSHTWSNVARESCSYCSACIDYWTCCETTTVQATMVEKGCY